jgi:hypothetical protein
MVTFECPWCAEPATLDSTTLIELECERCAIAVPIAADPKPAMLGQAA